MGLTAGDSLVLYLGRIEPRKGLDLTLEAFARTAAAFEHAALIFAGPEQEGFGDVLRRKARNLGISDRVKFAGMLDSTERVRALRDADIFALTSHSENFAIAAAEAMAAGVPAIISDRVGIAPDILSYNAGFVTSLDVTEISIVLRRLLSDPDLRNRLGQNAARLARDRYSRHSVARRVLENLQRITALSRRGYPAAPPGSPKPLRDTVSPG
jgi:glycosyltransferase involved in cell wall biosynthesis